MSWIGWCALDRVNAPRGLSIRAFSSAATSSLPGTGTALDRSETDRQQLAGVAALHRIDIGLAPGGLLVGGAKGLVLRQLKRIAVTQCRLQPLRGLALRRQCPVGQNAGTDQRDLVVEAGGRVVLDQFDGTPAGGGKLLLEAAHRFLARGVLPSQGHRPLQPAIGDDLAHPEGRLPIRERGAEDIGCAQRARRRTHPGVGMISNVPVSRATLTIAISTPECTVPIRKSTFSRLTSWLAFSGALDGSDSSSAMANSTSRPRSKVSWGFSRSWRL